MFAMFGKFLARLRAHPRTTLVVLTLAALVPFLGKPFNMDDPLFLWAAQHIAAHPLDPYGFTVDWGFTAFPMFKVTENPPLACYYLALAGKIFGWGETDLHAAFLLPAIAVVLGVHRLAQQFCRTPLLAAGLVLCTPVFLVSATTVMCDVLMLAFWTWAIIFWIEGTVENSTRKVFAGGILISLAVLTKHFGASLLPLLVSYSLARRRPLQEWGPAVLIGLVVMLAYQLWFAATYHEAPLLHAAKYTAVTTKIFGFTKIQNFQLALGFLGGGAAMVVLLAPAWMKRGEIIFAVAALALATAAVFSATELWSKFTLLQNETLVAAKIQIAIWVATGVLGLWLGAADFWRGRNPDALLLFFWLAGVFVFAAFFNWTVNGRSILPLVPAVAIIIVRRLEAENFLRRKLIAGGIVLAAALSWFVADGDFRKAVAVCETARQVAQQFDPLRQRVWYQGHWGFQFYLKAAGARSVDFRHPELLPGDFLAVPADNTNLRNPDAARADLLGVCRVPVSAIFSTQDSATGGGFYGALLGPLPFAIGNVPPETVAVFRLK
jgi:4-amino-4-deoxy-L-arabinose transferase-like glycosyltransferase